MNISNKIQKINISRTPFIKSGFLVVVLICLFSVSLYGQSLSQIELNYQNLTQEIQMEQTQLDSLNTVYNNMVLVIDKEKQRGKPDKTKITNLLASTVVISNKVKEQQIKLEKIENDLESLKKSLDKKYATKIDSIKKLQNSDNYTGDKEFLKSQILKYIEKRLNVAPIIYSLSFDPRRLIQHTPSSKNDSLEQKFFKEYLSNALYEVETQSTQLALLKNEIEEIVYLQNEAKSFMEDIDSEILFNPSLQSSEKSARSANVYFGGDPNAMDEISANVFFQANSYLHIFNQLKTSTTVDIQSAWQTPTDTIPANLTFQQYLDLLTEVDKMLQDYKLLLEHKLESD
jgi:hypothetical protein